jgi:hypothetical protein
MLQGGCWYRCYNRGLWRLTTELTLTFTVLVCVLTILLNVSG